MSDITVNNFKAFYEQIRPYLGAAHSGFTPIGTVISVMGTTAPLNYLACDGTVYNISDYPELAAYFNAQFGASNHFGGNGTTTFAVPDLRGEFLRGTGTNSHANQGSGANVGVHQDGTLIPRIQEQSPKLLVSANSGILNVDSAITKSDLTLDVYSRSEIIQPSYKDEMYSSRPTNTSVLYCIASKNIFMDAGSNYSTEEQVVGTWIDGEPIYQKTWTGLSIALADYDVINALDISSMNINKIIGCSLYNDTEFINTLMTIIAGNTLKVFAPFLGGNTMNSITLQYTKTTD